MESYFPRFTLITLGVDRLHQKAGSRAPLELNGSIWMTRCTGGCGEWEDRHELANLPPKCPQCGSLLRPGAAWIGERISASIWAAAEKSMKECDVLFVIGNSAPEPSSAGLIEEVSRNGKLVIEINPEETSLSSKVTLSIRSKASEALFELREALTRLAVEKGFPQGT